MTHYAASTDTRKGLTMDLYSNPRYRPCSAQGLAEDVSQVTVVEVRYADGCVKDMPKYAQVFTATPEAPAVALVERVIGHRIWHVEPIVDEGSKWFMAGGSYVATTDSRISEITNGFYGAFAFHDRWEG